MGVRPVGGRGPDPALTAETSRGSMASSAGSSGPRQRSVDVLVVDDDRMLRSTWAEILRSSGYSVAVASDGDVALDILKQEAVGVVLLDLRMPRRDGLSVLEALTTPQLVVLVSAYSLDAAMQARVDAKVVTYLEKPVPPERLLHTVASTLGRSGVDSSQTIGDASRSIHLRNGTSSKPTESGHGDRVGRSVLRPGNEIVSGGVNQRDPSNTDKSTRTIVSIAWYPHRPDWHELTYDNGDYERVPGTLEDAAALAEALKMESVPTRGGSVQWDRQDN